MRGSGAPRGGEAEAEIEVVVEGEGEGKVVLEMLAVLARGQRKRLSWIWQSILTSACESNLQAGEKVSSAAVSSIIPRLLTVSLHAVIGTLKGYDQLMNLVMDEVEELLRDSNTGEWTDETRALGLAVLRGTALTVINPADGFEQIAK